MNAWLGRTPEEALCLYNSWVEQGYEGAVHRNTDSMYEFGKRSYGAQKRKPRKTAECRVISSRKDKNGQGVLTVEAINGEHKGNQFDLLMRKDSSKDKNYREYENSLELVEMCATITYSYEGTSLTGVATKPVGTAIRPIDEHFDGKG